jgi:HPt (histidine-containing phosphotransfer) domain-containing protein
MSSFSMPPHRSVYAEDPLMQPLIAEFTSRLAGHVNEIRKAVAADDSAALHRILHQLRGSGQSYGFGPITNHAAVADEKIKAKRPLSECYSDINALIDYIEQIENYKSL